MGYRFDEKRTFRRHFDSSACSLMAGKKLYSGKLIDYSLNGACVIFNSPPAITSDTEMSLTIFNKKIHFKCEAMWRHETSDRFTIGFKRTDALKGSLEDFILSEILVGLQKTTKTGALKVMSGTIHKHVYIKNGNMIFASSNYKDDRLGEMLLREGKISLEQLVDSNIMIGKHQKRLGKILFDMGFKPEEIFLAVTRQIEMIILSIFDLHDGTFEFNEGPLPSEEQITIKMSAANIIYRGIKRLNSTFKINKACPPLDTVLNYSLKPLNIFQDIILDELDKKILSCINGKNTIRDILSLSPSNDFETMKTICALLHIRLIKEKLEGEHIVAAPLDMIINEPVPELTEEFVLDMDDLYNQIERLGYYETLGLERNASFEEITVSYYRISKKYHPDRHFSLTQDNLKEKLISINHHIDKAYSALSDPEKRTAYDKSLSFSLVEEQSETQTDRLLHDKERRESSDREILGVTDPGEVIKTFSAEASHEPNEIVYRDTDSMTLSHGDGDQGTIYPHEHETQEKTVYNPDNPEISSEGINAEAVHLRASAAEDRQETRASTSGTPETEDTGTAIMKEEEDRETVKDRQSEEGYENKSGEEIFYGVIQPPSKKQTDETVSRGEQENPEPTEYDPASTDDRLGVKEAVESPDFITKEQDTEEKKSFLKPAAVICGVLILAATLFFSLKDRSSYDQSTEPAPVKGSSSGIALNGTLPAFHDDAVRKILHDTSTEK